MLDNRSVIADCGRFNDADLDLIWSSPEYTDMQGEFLALMKEFEVCYEISGYRGHYIAPHLLEPNPPIYDIPWSPQDNLILTHRYTFKPKNIFPRLIVALHEYIEYQRMVWKHGVVLTNDSARAEIIEDDRYHQADIRIRISGTDKKQWLSVIGHHLDRINASFEKLEHEILFPCNCSECKGNQTPYEFPYKDLCRSLSKRNYTLKCLRSFEEVSVQTLINDVTDPRAYHERATTNTDSPNSSPFTNKVEVNVKFPEQQYQESTSVTVGGDAKDARIIAGKDNTATQPTEINQHGQGDNVAGNKIAGDSIGALKSTINKTSHSSATPSQPSSKISQKSTMQPRPKAKPKSNAPPSKPSAKTRHFSSA